MEKNNNGFTLVELLAIIVLLGIITALAAPNMTKQISKKEKTDDYILNQKIENAAHIYAAKYYADKIVSCTSTTGNHPCGIEFSLNELEQDGLINLSKNVGCLNTTSTDSESKSPIDGKIKVNYSSGKIKYDYNEIINANKCYKITTTMAS